MGEGGQIALRYATHTHVHTQKKTGQVAFPAKVAAERHLCPRLQGAWLLREASERVSAYIAHFVATGLRGRGTKSRNFGKVPNSRCGWEKRGGRLPQEAPP